MPGRAPENLLDKVTERHEFTSLFVEAEVQEVEAGQVETQDSDQADNFPYWRVTTVSLGKKVCQQGAPCGFKPSYCQD